MFLELRIYLVKLIMDHNSIEIVIAVDAQSMTYTFNQWYHETRDVFIKRVRRSIIKSAMSDAAEVQCMTSSVMMMFNSRMFSTGVVDKKNISAEIITIADKIVKCMNEEICLFMV